MKIRVGGVDGAWGMPDSNNDRNRPSDPWNVVRQCKGDGPESRVTLRVKCPLVWFSVNDRVKLVTYRMLGTETAKVLFAVAPQLATTRHDRSLSNARSWRTDDPRAHPSLGPPRSSPMPILTTAPVVDGDPSLGQKLGPGPGAGLGFVRIDLRGPELHLVDGVDHDAAHQGPQDVLVVGRDHKPRCPRCGGGG